ncbi:DUF924 domain-containing protein [Pseudomonas syringae]|nr:DUF924 domain-containing protein [Pseudomonas syringae]MBD8576661.1 DUF924 domain-containing protein [Pseudomonas syringae]MBD8788478.1 DUF924 domain-containing protein [Pseudomonas syringae]MBD8799322.1 DUF924 domain-containing protein [Pseudomonas syringae]MBD8811519.1 DUF924 domain-containing protein [Pseudomonas syringae]
MAAPWRELLDWWFGPAASPTEVTAARNALWFGKRKANDTQARERFGALVQQALAGDLQDWTADPEGWLALIVLLDQLPRMIHRDSARAHAGDARAQALLREGLHVGHDLHLTPVQRTFVYLVLEHSENLDDQDQAVARFAALMESLAEHQRAYFKRSLDYAERHRRIIARFGRFPHRNALLGRTSTPEEVEFLKTPGSGF